MTALHKRYRGWSLVFATYVVAALVTHVLWTGHVPMTAEILALALIVPTVQIAALEAIGRLSGSSWW